MSAKTSRRIAIGDRLAQGILWRLDRIGIHIKPFVTILEGSVTPDVMPLDSEFRFTSITAADIKELIELEPHYTPERLQGWFGEGKLCYGLRDTQRLVAKTWCDLAEMNYEPARRKLDADEAYLFAAYSDPAYRGRNLAPALRFACYAELRRLGYSRFYSHSNYFNRPARRFKQKLGAVEQDVGLHVDLFGRWSRTFTLKRYC